MHAGSAADPPAATTGHPRLARLGVALAIVATIGAATLATALVLLSVTQPAVVARVIGEGEMSGLLRVVVSFVVSGLARMLRYL